MKCHLVPFFHTFAYKKGWSLFSTIIGIFQISYFVVQKKYERANGMEKFHFWVNYRFNLKFPLSSISWSVSTLRKLIILPFLDLPKCGSECWECRTKHSGSSNSHTSVKISAIKPVHAFLSPLGFFLLSLSAHRQHDPIGTLSHSLCLQHGLRGRFTQPHTHQFTDGGRHWWPCPRQPEQNHGGVLLNLPEPSHHFIWYHSCVPTPHTPSPRSLVARECWSNEGIHCLLSSNPCI